MTGAGSVPGGALGPDVALADLVTDHPALAPVLEARGLDYCCGGHRTLAEACTREGMALGPVLDELARALVADDPGRADWAEMGPAALVDHLEQTHHRYLSAELPRLSALAAKVVAAHGERHPELAAVEQTLAALCDDLEPHQLKEERVLFPLVRALAAGDPAAGAPDGPLATLGHEHDQVGELLATLRDLTDGYQVPDDACASYRALYDGLAALEADTHLHVHKENHLLFPAVAALAAGRPGGSR